MYCSCFRRGPYKLLYEKRFELMFFSSNTTMYNLNNKTYLFGKNALVFNACFKPTKLIILFLFEHISIRQDKIETFRRRFFTDCYGCIACESLSEEPIACRSRCLINIFLSIRRTTISRILMTTDCFFRANTNVKTT